MPGKPTAYSKTPAQARLMAAAAHTPGGYGGVPQGVGQEFNQADAGTGILSKQKKLANALRKKKPAPDPSALGSG